MNYLLAAVCLLRAWRDANCTTVTGYEGGGVSIRCDYSEEYKDNSKYLCKRGFLCKNLIKTDKKNEWVTEGRFSLYDEPKGRFFTVNITSLQLTDTGTYRCAEYKWFWSGTYTEVSLQVLKGPKSTKTTKPTVTATTAIKGTATDTTIIPTVTSSTPAILVTASAKPSGSTARNTTSPETLLPITVGLTVVLLLLGLAVLIVYRQKGKKPAASKPLSDRTDTDSRHPDTIQCSSEYEEIKDQIAAVPSLYCTADLPENASPMTVYSTVGPSKASCSDSVSYTAVIFTENQACTNQSAINFTNDSEYATVKL
ncbi:CMRF35-like molecule 8 isoform X1 [Brienomyrus brachyistius]|uniref:CMRF35-like molecule 8 isoform X1 n=1 Tax=Brienomyrus brachyistius TaxID=42636 RepID=UPI0020B29FA7|nr:CMRF35-like molecule 8 isoform X1 [Brienomyrus brachyistius]